ncbi:MAG: hypothetical protein ACE5JH_03945 [Acidobacteriota bacterium]
MNRWFAIPLVALIPLGLSTPAAAQASGGGTAGIRWEGWGVRVGASSDPDQVYGGVHFDLGHFARDVRFRPTIEIGIGDDVTVVQALAEVHYVFSKVQVWKPYVGGGVGLTYVNRDDDKLPPSADDTDTDLALMGIGGIETGLKSGSRFFLELKIGFGDEDPDIKVGVGWTWR